MTPGKGSAGPGALSAVPTGSLRPGGTAGERALRTLRPAECFGLLERGGIGRVGFAAADGCAARRRGRVASLLQAGPGA
jgi:hypothetical protein